LFGFEELSTTIADYNFPPPHPHHARRRRFGGLAAAGAAAAGPARGLRQGGARGATCTWHGFTPLGNPKIKENRNIATPGRLPYDEEVLPLLGPTTVALFGRVSQACRDAVEDALSWHSPEGELTCACRSAGVAFIVEHFVATVALLSWAKDNGCPWDDRTCEAAFAGGPQQVLEWARGQGCPWDSGVLREWRLQFPVLRALWKESVPVTAWEGVTYGELGGADAGRVVEIDIGRNQLASVPASLGELTALTTLWLSGNQLTSVPAALGELTALRELYLFDNQLTSVPAALGGLTALTHLDLSHNNLTGDVPAALGELTALRKLNLSGNQLTTVPAALGRLTALTSLYLFGNQLTSVPAALGGFTALTHLDLSHNNLTGDVPAALGKLTALTELSLARNHLTGDVPAALGRLTALKELNLFGNQLTRVPAEWEVGGALEQSGCMIFM
jgi:hypothetical protein